MNSQCVMITSYLQIAMASILMSEAERTFILHGVEENLRSDGRARGDLRPVVIETGVVSHASGSCHLRLANTDILVGVKTELESPLPAAPDRGRLEFFVDCSANATPSFEGRGGESLATSISGVLSRAYSSPEVMDLKKLVVLPGNTCWILYVDILVLELGGNIYDAVSIAVKAALATTRIPKLTVTQVDGGEPEIEITDSVGADSYDSVEVKDCPVVVTMARIGNHCVVDPSPEEEECSSATLLLAVTPRGSLTTVRKLGEGSFHPSTIMAAVKTAVQVGVEVNTVLMKKLEQERRIGDNRQIVGFL